MNKPNSIPLIFDNDAGNDIDDLLALALVLEIPAFDILGITTVSGDPEPRTRLIAKMLRLAKRSEIPCFTGIDNPRAFGDPKHTAKKNPHSHTQFVTEEDPEFNQEYPDAVEFILNQLRNSSTPITILVTGNFTNIAAVIEQADEQQLKNIAGIAAMGGEVHWQHMESNIKNDPEAADIVFSSKVPIFLATWSVSREFNFTIDEIRELCSQSQTEFMDAMLECTNLWWGEGAVYKKGPVCYDIIPVFWAAGLREHISCIKAEELPVELDGKLTRGLTYFHPWKRLAAANTETWSSEYLSITDAIDANALRTQYIDLVFERKPS